MKIGSGRSTTGRFARYGECRPAYFTFPHRNHDSPVSNTLPQLATKFRPEGDAFEVAVDAGFECAEFWLDGSFLSRWRSIAEVAEQFALDYALHFPNRGDLSAEMLDGAVALYRSLGCRAMVIHQPMRERYGEELLQRDANLGLGVENHRLDIPGFWNWAEENDGLTLDVEHLWLFTLQDAPLKKLLQVVEEFLSRFVGKLRHVHLPGYVPGQGTHRPISRSPDMAAAVLSLLAEYGYSGFVVSEANAQFQNVTDLRPDVEFFQRWRNTVTSEVVSRLS